MLQGTINLYLTFTDKVTGTTFVDTVNRNINFGTAAGIGIQDFTLGASLGAKSMWTYSNPALTGTVTFDLTALPVPQSAGVATGSPIVTAAVVKGIFVQTGAADGQILYLGNAGTNPFSAFLDTATTRVKVMGSSPFAASNLLAQGSNAWTVDGTHKNLMIDAGANTFAVQLALLIA